jgi:hypothetical protein
VETQCAVQEIAATRAFTLSRHVSDAAETPSLQLLLHFPWTPGEVPNAIGCTGLAAVKRTSAGEPRIIEIQDFAGIGLASLLNGEKPDEEFSFEILRALAAALDGLHAAGRVHGALHPSSIVVGDDAQVRIVDWMIDWNRVPLSNRAHAAEYVAPEALAGADPGPSADQFALGVIAFQLLTGRFPFPGASLAEMIFRARYGLLDRDPLGDTRLAAQVVFDRVLSADPAERFESCSAFVQQLKELPRIRNYNDTRLAAADLDQFGQGVQSSLALPEDTEPGAGVQIRKSRFGWWTAAAALSLLAMGLGTLDGLLQARIGKLTDEEMRIASVQSANSLASGTLRVCNVSPDYARVSELAVAYWGPNQRLRVFTSPAYTHSGWVIAPGSSRVLSWPLDGNPTWDGSVLFYFLRVQKENKDFAVTGRWEAGGQGCLHL